MTIISLVSEQTLPNVLFLRAYSDADRHILLSTEQSEAAGRSRWIRQAANLRAIEIVILPPEDLPQIRSRLATIRFDPDEVLSINLTGGTKMMALGAYQHFTERYPTRSRIYYVSLENGQVHEIFPGSSVAPMATRLSLATYLTAHGVRLVSRGPMDFLSWQSQADETFQHLTGIRHSTTIAEKIGKGNSLRDPHERKFYTGEWLEVWAYHQVRAGLNLAPDQIRQGVHLVKHTPSGQSFAREYDLVFIRNNHLHLLEAKVWPGKSGFAAPKANLDLYKLAQARRELGLYARGHFWTVNEPGPQALQAITPNLELLGIRFAGPEILRDPALRQIHLSLF